MPIDWFIGFNKIITIPNFSKCWKIEDILQ